MKHATDTILSKLNWSLVYGCELQQPSNIYKVLFIIKVSVHP